MPLEDSKIIEEALKIVELANERKVILRILGAIAIRIHSEGFKELHQKLNRLKNENYSFTDIDLIGYSSQRGGIRKLMEKDLGFYIPRQFLLLHGKERLIYTHPEGLYQVDIFMDKLSFSHEIFFGKKPGKGRLEFDYPTIPLTDLLLEKLQIHEINEKDIKDIIVFIRSHTLTENYDKNSIVLNHLSSILCDDWGFWYDAIQNLKKVVEFTKTYVDKGILSNDDFNDIISKVNKIISYLEESPKTKKWIKRSKIGINKKWWRDVEEIYRD